jgi:hypothetical protein
LIRRLDCEIDEESIEYYSTLTSRELFDELKKELDDNPLTIIFN